MEFIEQSFFLVNSDLTSFDINISIRSLAKKKVEPTPTRLIHDIERISHVTYMISPSNLAKTLRCETKSLQNEHNTHNPSNQTTFTSHKSLNSILHRRAPVDKLMTALDFDIGFTGKEINNIQNHFQLDTCTSQDTNILCGWILQIIQVPS